MDQYGNAYQGPSRKFINSEQGFKCLNPLIHCFLFLSNVRFVVGAFLPQQLRINPLVHFLFN